MLIRQRGLVGVEVSSPRLFLFWRAFAHHLAVSISSVASLLARYVTRNVYTRRFSRNLVSSFIFDYIGAAAFVKMHRVIYYV